MKRLLLLTLFLGAVVGVHAVAPAVAATNPRELVFVEGTDVVPLDPQFVTSTPTWGPIRILYDGLVTFDPDMQIVPRLARSFEVSADGNAWTFKLRPGVKFSDGSAFTARAVKFTLERAMVKETASPHRSLLLTVDRVETPDDLTVRIVTKAPNPELLVNLASPGMSVLSPEATTKYSLKDYGRHPVGTGPYRLEEWTPGDRVVFVPNPHYWGNRPKLDRIVYRPVPEAGVRAAMLRTGEADIVVKLTPEDLKALEADPNITVRAFNTMYQIAFELNVEKGPLKDKRVRLALNHAVDKASIVKNILRGMGEPMVSPLGPGIANRATFTAYAYEPARAKQLLAEAGYPNGFPMTLWSPNGRYLKDREVSEAVQGYLRAAGVQAELRLWEWGPYVQAVVKDPSREAMMLGRATPGTDFTVTRLFTKGSIGLYNSTNFWTPDLEALIPEARSIFDPKKRADLYRRIQQVVWEEAPWIFLHNQKQIVGLRKNVDGFAMLPHEIMLLENVSKR